MSRALSFDLRVRVLAAVSDGLTHRQAGERFGVGAASVSRWRKLEREQGNPKPKALGGGEEGAAGSEAAGTGESESDGAEGDDGDDEDDGEHGDDGEDGEAEVAEGAA
jgi:hypothetical protein